jgi:MFS family permease
MQLTSLRSRQFRHFFIGHAASILGSWIQQVALSWLIYRVTGSAALLGIAAALLQFPQMIVGPLAGSLVDRYDSRKLFLFALGAGAMLGLGLAVAAWMELSGPVLLLTATALTGICNALESPLRQTLIPELVRDRALLSNALALNAAVFNSARFVGPPLAGMILAVTSEAWCFVINAVSYIGMMIFVWNLKLQPKAPTDRDVLGMFVDGLRYLGRHWMLKRILGLSFTQNIATGAVLVLLPVWAADVYTGDSRTLGWLLGASGAGSLCGTLLLTRLATPPAWLRAITAGWLLTILGTATMALLPPLPVTLAALFGFGFGLTMCNVLTNVMTQTISPDALRGRMISLFIGGRWGFDALGGLVAGALASAAGLRPTLVLQLLILMAAASFFIRIRPELGRRFEAQGDSVSAQ